MPKAADEKAHSKAIQQEFSNIVKRMDRDIQKYVDTTVKEMAETAAQWDEYFSPKQKSQAGSVAVSKARPNTFVFAKEKVRPVSPFRASSSPSPILIGPTLYAPLFPGLLAAFQPPYGLSDPRNTIKEETSAGELITYLDADHVKGTTAVLADTWDGDPTADSMYGVTSKTLRATIYVGYYVPFWEEQSNLYFTAYFRAKGDSAVSATGSDPDLTGVFWLRCRALLTTGYDTGRIPPEVHLHCRSGRPGGYDLGTRSFDTAASLTDEWPRQSELAVAAVTIVVTVGVSARSNIRLNANLSPHTNAMQLGGRVEIPLITVFKQ